MTGRSHLIGANSYMGGECPSCGADAEDMRRRIRQLEAGNGHLIVDGDRRERRAMEAAKDCAEHGNEIHYLRHMADWCWALAARAEQAHREMVNALLRLHDRMTEDEIRATLRAGLGAQAKVMRKPARYPTFADCLRSGGCHHDGLTDGLRAAARMQDAAPGNELGPAEEAGDA